MKTKSFFEKLTGIVKAEEPENNNLIEKLEDELEIDDSDGQLAIDVYQTPTEIIIKSMVAGVKPEDLDISITRDMVTIKGKREESKEASGDDFFHKELYWGSFSRSVVLPQEIEVEEAEATNKNGLLTIKLPKLDKHKQAKVKVRSL